MPPRNPGWRCSALQRGSNESLRAPKNAVHLTHTLGGQWRGRGRGGRLLVRGVPHTSRERQDSADQKYSSERHRIPPRLRGYASARRVPRAASPFTRIAGRAARSAGSDDATLAQLGPTDVALVGPDGEQPAPRRLNDAVLKLD